MTKRSRDIPDGVEAAASSAWRKWGEKIAAAPPAPHRKKNHFDGAAAMSASGETPRERMIAKIKRRMKEYPEWYETDPARLSASVAAQLDRIGLTLARLLPETEEPVEIWLVPLSVFNWLIEDAEGERFFRGALSAWSHAEDFNAANSPHFDRLEKARLRTPFLAIAPPLLKAVLEPLLETGLWVTFGQKYIGSELKYLEMRAQRPPEETEG